jgi:hypothetical protein
VRILTYTVGNKLRVFAMGTVVIATVENPNRIFIFLRKTSEELAEARLILFSHLWSGRHYEKI